MTQGVDPTPAGRRGGVAVEWTGGSGEPFEAPVLEALDRGDKDQALTILMRCYGSAVFRYCCQMLRDSSLAEDQLQTTFLEAYRDFHRFARRSSLRVWLFGIAHHRCLDALKKHKRHDARFSALEEQPERRARDPSLEDGLATAELAGILEECLEELDARIRTAVLLRYAQGLSYPEMAIVCSEQAATLQARVSRALPVLRRCVEGQGIRHAGV